MQHYHMPLRMSATAAERGYRAGHCQDLRLILGRAAAAFCAARSGGLLQAGMLLKLYRMPTCEEALCKVVH